jgi:H+/Cl- antiporter ClcA
MDHNDDPDDPPASGHARRLAARLAGGASHQGRLTLWLLRWIALGIGVGVLAGLSSAVFLKLLEWSTRSFADHHWLLWLLPVAGLSMGCLYHYTGGRAIEGNVLILDEIHEPRTGVPRRMAPLVLISTVATNLFGGSAGREGTAIQMAASLTDSGARLLHLSRDERRTLLVAGMGAGFGAVFGVPLAGAVFGLEVQSVGRVRYEALVPSLTGALVGDLVVRGLGVHHTPTPLLGPVDLDAGLLLKIAVAGLVFGLVSAIFIEAVHLVKRVGARLTGWPPARPVIGGVVVIALTLLVGNYHYNGLSVPLAVGALAGHDPGFQVFALKLVFTAATLGFGFYGGEVTPLLVIGATLGAALGPVLGVPIALLAAVGYVAVLAGAANTPLACTIMAVELFGGQALEPAAVGCVVAYVFSSHRSIYASQRLEVAKGRWIGPLGHALRDHPPRPDDTEA